ncbi:TPA: restriction endonuclease subunit S [Vibrio parahaemolyticus]|nr:restriction endonuclease subunit S [Vibrio parahaemolyticus]EII3141440.1 restriction endonuclease subunit S [Vibrio parahaemolyticus]HCE2285265.1 restriction endonuclease subunit S [Vibrio parahaemolyticus]HCH3266061.1 restriction endonuclease subunit S [Vibrio parahaemolyticus]
MALENLITEHIDIWTSAVKNKSTSGRGSSKKLELYGIKKLRELILDLAVRGKLIPQVPSDKPAKYIITKASAMKEELTQQKKIRKQKPLPLIRENETPFKCPTNWLFCRMGDLGLVASSSRVQKKDWTDNGIPFYRAREIVQLSRTGSVDNELFISESLFETLSENSIGPEAGDIMLTGVGTIGVPYVVRPNDRFYYKDASVLIFKNLGGIISEYLALFMCSPLWKRDIHEESMGTTVHTLTIARAANTVIPVPPIEEQHRIVAKVDELMALCDQLEQQTEASIEAHQVLVTTLLDTLTNSADANELMQNWARISEHFDTLFTTEESIDQLKQTILQLAVMGALSQPLNSDTPIDVHLDNILEQQKQLATAKEYSLIEAEVLKAKNEISNNRVVLKARCFCNFITKGTTPSKNELLETGDVPFLKVYNIVNNELDFDYRPIFISNEVHTSKLKRSIAHPGDVIMNIVGPPLGKVAVLSEQYPQWNMNQALAVFKPVSSVFNRYLYYVLSCELTLRSVLSEVKGTAGQDNLSLEQCRDLLVPIMSIQEQQRLVCLVDSLWDYCDRLKKRMKSSQKTQLHLTDAVTGQAV